MNLKYFMIDIQYFSIVIQYFSMNFKYFSTNLQLLQLFFLLSGFLLQGRDLLANRSAVTGVIAWNESTVKPG